VRPASRSARNARAPRSCAPRMPSVARRSGTPSA
jgi:hypothetical protein